MDCRVRLAAFLSCLAWFMLPVTRSFGAGDSELTQIRIPTDAVEKEVPHAASGNIAVRKRIYRLNDAIVGERLYYTNGQLAQEKMFQAGTLHGVWAQFYESGQQFSQRPYRMGIPDGIFRFWGPDGQLLGESTIVRGDGTLREFWLSGLETDDAETPLLKGMIHGTRKRWGRFHRGTGFGVNITKYSNNGQDGWSITYDEDGVLLNSSYWKSGEIHGVTREWNRDGSFVKGSPQYVVDGMKVTMEQYVAAAKDDEILNESLKNDGKNVKFQREPEIKKPMDKTGSKDPSSNTNSARAASVSDETPPVAQPTPMIPHVPPRLTPEERQRLEQARLTNTLIRYWPVSAILLAVALAWMVARTRRPNAP